jgi:hypothetical protein
MLRQQAEGSVGRFVVAVWARVVAWGQGQYEKLKRSAGDLEEALSTEYWDTPGAQSLRRRVRQRLQLATKQWIGLGMCVVAALLLYRHYYRNLLECERVLDANPQLCGWTLPEPRTFCLRSHPRQRSGPYLTFEEPAPVRWSTETYSTFERSSRCPEVRLQRTRNKFVVLRAAAVYPSNYSADALVLEGDPVACYQHLLELEHWPCPTPTPSA